MRIFHLNVMSLVCLCLLQCLHSHANSTVESGTVHKHTGVRRMAHQHMHNGHDERVLSRIAFGSCNKHNKPQPLWPVIETLDPQLFVWLGDAVYADKVESKGGIPLPWFRSPAQLADIENVYLQQKNVPEYKHFIQFMNSPEKAGVVGVWDDHDMGQNDGNRFYVDRAGAQQLFLDFLDVAKESPLRRQHGVYSAHTYGPPGKRVKLLLLDIRYHADAVQYPEGHPVLEDTRRDESSGAYADMLGEEQWRWLEDQLMGSSDPAQLVLIGSGVQVVSTAKPIAEAWNKYPHSKKRLFELITRYTIKAQTKDPLAGAVMFLSGDVHLGEFSRTYNCIRDEGHQVVGARSLWDLTSSGMTHAWGYVLPPFLRPFALTVYNLVIPRRERVDDVVIYRNFGYLEIDWDSSPPVVTASIRILDGSKHLERHWKLTELTAPIQPQRHDRGDGDGRGNYISAEEWEQVLESCQRVEELEFGTGGYYFRGVIVAQYVTFALLIGFVIALVLLLLCCRRTCACCSRRPSKAKDS